jgi:hypothetical protein
MEVEVSTLLHSAHTIGWKKHALSIKKSLLHVVETRRSPLLAENRIPVPHSITSRFAVRSVLKTL